jgi:hypothetical protein
VVTRRPPPCHLSVHLSICPHSSVAAPHRPAPAHPMFPHPPRLSCWWLSRGRVAWWPSSIRLRIRWPQCITSTTTQSASADDRRFAPHRHSRSIHTHSPHLCPHPMIRHVASPRPNLISGFASHSTTSWQLISSHHRIAPNDTPRRIAAP